MESTNVEFIPAGVADGFSESIGVPFEYVTAEWVGGLLRPRSDDAHKGTYGHALLVCGSRGMAGAAVLATGAALRSGCGLVTAHLPEDERFALTANYPSALLSLDPAHFFSRLPSDIGKYTSLGIGCGMGQRPETAAALSETIDACRENSIRLVVDADALNIISGNSSLMNKLPENTILTPHLGELKRLIGEWESEEEKYKKVIELAARHKLTIVVKGPNTAVCIRGESIMFNSTGNSGMAKGGSGDVLTGFITGLLARGYTPDEAAVMGVFIHGLAGDKACDYFGAEGMNSADIIDFLADAITELQQI